ncbi:uncharacterized protein JCM6883_000594 [Sporobolomyces salmoneus]|uniref:uncharacterized protein n=1 Tax=Sporobolomyces salmoneus TaxID=183962 RepID=UPI003177BCC1
MASEMPQQVHSALEELAVDASRSDVQSKVDRFSFLPPEILDDLYDLAAYENRLPIMAPSKRLRPHHERARYKSVEIGSNAKLKAFSKALKKQPHWAIFVKTLSFSGYGDSAPPPRTRMFHVFSKLPALVDLTPPRQWPQLVEMVERGDNPGHYLKSLETCRLGMTELSSALLTGLSSLPKLRRVEIASVSPDLQQSLVIADQVTELLIDRSWCPIFDDTSPGFPDPSSFLRFFPSAKIVSLALFTFVKVDYDWIRQILSPLAPSLRSLSLWEGDKPVGYLPLINNSIFTNLRELSITTPSLLVPSNLSENSIPFPNLISLSLVIVDLRPDILKLFRGPQRLRHLQYLRVEYAGCHTGRKLDIRRAEAEMKVGKWDKGGRGWALINKCFSMEDMEEEGWRLPFVVYGVRGSFHDQENGGFKNGFRVAEEMEEVAKKAGISILHDVTLEEVRNTLSLQILEYHSRGVADAYLRRDSSIIEDARRLADLHGVPLPPLLVDLDRELPKDKLKYFKVDMSEAFDVTIPPDERWKWSTYNLRYREEGEVDSSSSEEDSDSVGSDSSEE